MKRFLSLLLAICLFAGLAAIPVGAVSVTRPKQFQTVSMGGSTACAVDRSGVLWIWGLISITGEGIDQQIQRASKPQRWMDQIKDVSAGYMHVAALKTDGSVWTWGSNFDGRLGDGTETHRFTPQKILDNVKAISAGSYHSLALKNDGTLWAWGANDHGQIGDGTKNACLSPKKIADHVIAISAGEDESLFIKDDHTLWGMGSQSGAELGSLSFDDQLTPVRVMGGIAAVCAHDGLLIKTDGSAWEYGSLLKSENKQYGARDFQREPTPRKVADNAAYIASGSLLRFVVQTDGKLLGWGTNIHGQLGDGTDVWKTAPKQIMSDVSRVSTNGESCLAVKRDGSLWAWGNNASGQLGDGTQTDRYTPVQIIIPETVELPTQFYDVAQGAYYADAVQWAVDAGVTKGVDDTHFGPDKPCTRAQAVTFLWRAAGSPEPKVRGTAFTDVQRGSYYEKAVQWAAENNVTAGTSKTTFSPENTCTRGQIVTFLFRASGSPAVSGGKNPFRDVSSGAYYESAVRWAVTNGITNGTSDTTFSPENTCTRGQIVTFLYRDIREKT